MGSIAPAAGNKTSGPGSGGKIKAGSFTALLEHRGNEIVVTMRGNADMAAHERLKACLDELHLTARTSRAKAAVFELGELYFMNSTCLSLFLRFINTLVETPASERYTVRFKSNPNLRWQQKSLAALQAYAHDLVVIE